MMFSETKKKKGTYRVQFTIERGKQQFPFRFVYFYSPLPISKEPASSHTEALHIVNVNRMREILLIRKLGFNTLQCAMREAKENGDVFLYTKHT